MRRYLLFSGDTYYPVGGADDFIGSFSTIEEAKEEAKMDKDDWWHIFDTEEIKVIKRSRE